MRSFSVVLFLLFNLVVSAQNFKREIVITKNYLNLPVQSSRERNTMSFKAEGETIREFIIRLSNDKPDYWVFADVSGLKGKTVTIFYPEEVKGLNDIYQSDVIAGYDSLYEESNRPQFHFTSKRGWNNDPNGLVFYDGEYHLFYQHNPFEINWQNMHWGHAVSKDLIHWQELPDALHPDELGTMFSGSAIVDSKNTSGWQTGDEKLMVAAYTANGPEKQVQCIAYSNDKGRTFKKYEGNPVIDSHERINSFHTRDPKVFWFEKDKKWVMVLFEKNGHSIYNSNDLKNWTYKSHIGGFWECPELFRLPVDGDEKNQKWVMYGASGTYMIGEFNGEEFSPETDKMNYYSGKMYAAQTFNNIPETDGRCIQIGWGQINHPGMPFNQMMTFPTELTLRSTRNGIRLFSEPIDEIEHLYKENHIWHNLSMEEANNKLKELQGELFNIEMKVEVLEGNHFEILFNGNSIVQYSFNSNKLNGSFYSGENTEMMTIDLELLIDKTSAEIFADKGRFTVIEQLPESKNNKGFAFVTGRSEIKVHELSVHELKSAW